MNVLTSTVLCLVLAKNYCVWKWEEIDRAHEEKKGPTVILAVLWLGVHYCHVPVQERSTNCMCLTSCWQESVTCAEGVAKSLA